MSCAGSSSAAEGIFGFPTGELALAGEWVATVEYTEPRADLARGLTKKSAVLRSPAATFEACSRDPLWSMMYTICARVAACAAGFSQI